MDPDSEGPLYCAEQIKIPAELPDILKEFTKAAIRTQPADVLRWSAAYFKALHAGEAPPVKGRLEPDRLEGLSKGCLAVLHTQLSYKETVSVTDLTEKWKDVGCDLTQLNELLAIGDMREEVDWLKFLALACTILEKSLPDALKSLCEIVTSDPEGGPARIPVAQFQPLYEFLAYVDGEISKEQVDTVMEFLNNESHRHNGTVGPREFLHPKCPKLHSGVH